MSGPEQDPRVDILAEATVGYGAWNRFSEEGRNSARFDAWGLLSRLDAARPASPAPEHGESGAAVLARMANGYYNIAGGFHRAGDQQMANWALTVSSEAAREAVRLDPSLGDALSAAVNGAPGPEHATPDDEGDDPLRDIADQVDGVVAAWDVFDPERDNLAELRGAVFRLRRLAALPAPVAPDREEVDVDALRIAREVLAKRDVIELVAERYHRLVDPMVPPLNEKGDSAETYRDEARKAIAEVLLADRITGTTGEDIRG